MDSPSKSIGARPWALSRRAACATRRLAARLACLGLTLASSFSCKVYDAQRLTDSSPLPAAAQRSCGDGLVDETEFCDIAIAAGQRGACPDTCESPSACDPVALIGSDCQRHCVRRVIEDPTVADGCCPPEAIAAEDPDCGFCGDGEVGAGERCDPRAPGGCPDEKTCVSKNPCVKVVLSGSADQCNAHCTRREISICQSGDQCCPAGCAAGIDNDCSPACGDGRFDAERGETCDTKSATMPCPVTCDDEDANTRDSMSGHAENCTAVCEHTALGSKIDGDGICDAGSTSLNDSDCPPTCGNGAVEAGEQCDGSMLCDSACKTLSQEQFTCHEAFRRAAVVPPDACTRCACNHCSSTMLGCFASAFEARNELCEAVVNCATKAGCRGAACLCTGACTAADGACASELADATGTQDVAAMQRRISGDERYTLDSNYAGYYAEQYGACIARSCAAECAPSAIAAQPTAGSAAPPPATPDERHL